MHILVKYASRSRPSRFFEGLNSILTLAADKDRITIISIHDLDDPFYQDYRDGLLNYDILSSWGYSKSKIDAINRPVPDDVAWDILVNFSDDMRFTVHGWDELIRDGFRINGLDKFLHYPDSTAKHMLPTMSIMGRKYFERDGYIYHPSYKSLWCDNEAMEVAKFRGCYVYMGIQIFDHYHPAYGLAQWDEQYHRQQGFWNEDELNYIYRKSKNFFLQ